ncbi:MAG TPA: carboxypeptidase regulatory-like domain-containing protein [Vicinamibacterales bacterium]|nr:carboxypeptidase regulatory-like domain-containing protein [Vicinamibacterales bacterium]
MGGAIVRVSTLMLLVMCAAVPAAAQSELGTITGTIKDAQGAVLPGVTVTAQNTATNVSTTAVSNSEGVYLVPSLINGTYKVTFMLSGFAPSAREIQVRAGDRLRVDMALDVGAMTEEVRVVAETPLLETTTATRSQVLDQAKVESLPLSGRNPYALAYTVTGVTTQVTRESISFRPFDNGGMDGISINGGVVRSNEFLLDGAPNASREGNAQGSLAFVPSPDAVQEVRVSTNTYDAQFGRTGGGVIAVSIRSGTNRLRGTAYYNHRDASLNSNLFENKVRGIPKEDLFHYNPGFTVGGPVKLPKYDGTNKTFFFYSFEGLKSGIPVSSGERAPTDLERAGDFSQSGAIIYDPLNTVSGVPQPFPGNVIPSSRIDPVARTLMSYMVQPNTTPDASSNNFFARENSRFDTYTSGIIRIDHNFSARHRLFGRYGHNGRRETRAKSGRAEEALTAGYHHRWNNVLSVDLTSTLTPTLLSSARAGWTRHRRLDISGAEDMGGFDPAALGWPSTYTSALPRRFPPIRITDYGGASIGQGGGQDGPSDDFYVLESLTKVMGRHQLKFGAEYRYGISTVENPLGGVNLGNLQFSRNFTSLRPNIANLTAADGGNAFASFLLGYMASTSVQLSPIFDWRSSYTGVFVQEDWRLSNRLTLNAGLRWEYEAPVTETKNQVNGGFDFDALALNCPLCPASGLPAQLKGGLTFADGAFYTKDLNNFGPRFGFTYNATRKAVVRGGYGLTYLDSSTDRGTQTGFTRTTTYVASLDAGRTPANRLANPFPTGVLQPAGPALGPATALGTNISFHTTGRKIPEFHQWSIGMQHELPWRSVVDVSYIGSATRKIGVTQPINDLSRDQILLGDAFLNALVPNPFIGLMPDGGALNTAATIQRRQLLRPYPQFGTISQNLIPIGTRDYQALQISWDKRLSHGVHLSTAYTGSRSVQRTSPLNQGEPLFEEVTADHRPHVLRLTGGWQLPAFDKRGVLLRLLAGGWQVNASTFFRSGITVGMPGNVDLIGDPVLKNPTTARWFNTCTLTTTGARQGCASDTEQPAFRIRAENALDTTGDRLEGVYRSEPFILDMSFFKTIRTGGRTSFQIRVEMFNAFDKVMWPNPNTTITSPQFGMVTETQSNDPRFVQIAFRFSY